MVASSFWGWPALAVACSLLVGLVMGAIPIWVVYREQKDM